MHFSFARSLSRTVKYETTTNLPLQPPTSENPLKRDETRSREEAGFSRMGVTVFKFPRKQ